MGVGGLRWARVCLIPDGNIGKRLPKGTAHLVIGQQLPLCLQTQHDTIINNPYIINIIINIIYINDVNSQLLLACRRSVVLFLLFLLYVAKIHPNFHVI